MATSTKPTPPLPDELHLAIDAHVRYIQSLDHQKDQLEYWLTEHLRLNGLYWGLTALHLLRHPLALPRDETIAFVLSCQTASGGFGAAPGHDEHILSTCSAIQILVMVDGLQELGQEGKRKTAQWIAQCQNRETGTFRGDEWGEEDTRFLHCGLISLSFLGGMDLIDSELATDFLVRCANFDGGYGVEPGAESHSGQIFACLGAFSILGKMDKVDAEKLGMWLSERQVDAGGLNGRPEKLEDVCYSWWVGSSLAMLGKLHWVDGEALKKFILKCQDPVNGGIADRPGDMVDVFHTVFGIAGLSLLDFEGLEEVDPVYCMPRKVVERVLGPRDWHK